MAYTRRSSADGTTPLPGADPGVVSMRLTNSASEINIPVKVPWDGCRLAYAYTVVTTVIDTVGAMSIDLELDTAGGSEIGNVDTSGATIGTETELTFTDESYARHLDSGNKIVVEIDGSTTGTGACDLFLYFEPDIA